MDSWKEHRDAWLKVNPIDLLNEIFRESRVQDEVIRLNHEQLDAGIDSQDKKINTIGGSPYRPYTVNIKKIKGQPTDRVTLYDTGQFYNTFRLKVLKDGFEIIADFRKGSDDIRDNLPSDFDVLGLTGESLAELVWETILPRLQKMYLQRLNV